MTGFTEQEFEALLPPFERAFVAYMHDQTIDGQPRTVLRYRTYDTCPLPTIADKLLLILTYVKQNPIQEVQGQLFGMSQSHANKWIHLLHSGKKTCQTIKNLLIIDATCHMCFLSATSEGKANDQSLADLEGYTLPRGSCLDQDLGFQG